jgi:hypothetical protein
MALVKTLHTHLSLKGTKIIHFPVSPDFKNTREKVHSIQQTQIEEDSITRAIFVVLTKNQWSVNKIVFYRKPTTCIG